MSLGKSVEESAASDPLVLATEDVWDAGLTVVCSAGNYGRDGHFTITSPGNSRKVITVGSVTDSGTNSDYDDYVSTYSSLGPTAYDHFLKPDLVAPGNRVVAPIAHYGRLKNDLPDRVLSCGVGCTGEYLELSGTSMAAAMVSGTAALMLTDDPSLSPDTVKARLMRSARKVIDDPTVAGAGVLDIAAALGNPGPCRPHPHQRWTAPAKVRWFSSKTPLSCGGTTTGARRSSGRMPSCGPTPFCGATATCGRMPSCGRMLSSGQTPSCGRRFSLVGRLPVERCLPVVGHRRRRQSALADPRTDAAAGRRLIFESGCGERSQPTYRSSGLVPS